MLRCTHVVGLDRQVSACPVKGASAEAGPKALVQAFVCMRLRPFWPLYFLGTFRGTAREFYFARWFTCSRFLTPPPTPIGRVCGASALPDLRRPEKEGDGREKSGGQPQRQRGGPAEDGVGEHSEGTSFCPFLTCSTYIVVPNQQCLRRGSLSKSR